MFKLFSLGLWLCLASQASASDWFVDEAGSSGFAFRHVNGMTGAFHFPEILGPGGALFDLEGDGDLDIFVVQSGLFSENDKEQLVFSDDKNVTRGNRLFRNDSKPDATGKLVWKFTDITNAALPVTDVYGMGVSTGDIDNDGDLDLYVTNLGANQLLRNNGDGTLTDITATSGTAGNAWSTSAVFADLNRDGLVDLYVTNYVEYKRGDEPNCFAKSSARDYCGPDAFAAAVDRLYLNKGDGTFQDGQDLVKESNLRGAGLGVIASDFDLDGWLDIYVANDGDANFLLLNGQGKAFRDEALLSGVAVNRVGAAEASMGVTAGDFDGDGDEDLFMTHLMGETNTLYINDGNLIFEDQTDRFGLGAPSRRFTAFGTLWFDYDNDGWLDLLVLNGAVRMPGDYQGKRANYPLDEPNQLFHNQAGKRFQDVTAKAGKAFGQSHVSRGAAFGDLDNDGDIDVLLLNNQGPAELFRNEAAGDRRWLGLRIVTGQPQRDALGARLAVKLSDQRTIWRTVRTDGSFLSAHDPRVIVGLDQWSKPVTVTVHWLDGKQESFEIKSIDRYVTLEQGKGVEVKP